MRGEHWQVTIEGGGLEGSSPHARGTLLHAYDRRVDGGIIPACAGNTPVRVLRRQRPGDHPRMRGEHSKVGWNGAEGKGSSPHARGTRAIWYALDTVTGIIPACAGNTRS